jgi:phage tail-like protein
MANYPLLSCSFVVEWGGAPIRFAEVAGLTATLDAVEVRAGADLQAAAPKVPGLAHYPNVLFRRGMMPGDDAVYAWFDSFRNGASDRRDVVIRLQDARRSVVFAWRLRNAFPVRVSYGPLEAARSRVLVEELEVAHEGLEVETFPPP